MWKRGEIAPKEQFLLFSTLFYIYIFLTVPGHFGPVISALSRFGPGLFQPGSFRPVLVGRFGLIFFRSPRLWIIGRTFIWLFDEESIVMSKAFF